MSNQKKPARTDNGIVSASMQDKVATLPLELWRVILSHLALVDLCHCCQVSKAWQELVQSLDNTRWKELYLFKNPWKHPNWPNRSKQDPKSWQKAYKERFLATKQWLRSGADAKCGLFVLRLIKKRGHKVLHVGRGYIYLRLRDAVAASSAFDTICIYDETREEQTPLVIKHPIEIIGKGTGEGKVRLNAIEVQSGSARISNVLLRSGSHRAQNPLATILKVTHGTLYLDSSVIENGHVQVSSPGAIRASYCTFHNASIQLRTWSACKIEHCEFHGGEHSGVLIEGTHSDSKPRSNGMNMVEWMSRHCNKFFTVEELYSHVVQTNTQQSFKGEDNKDVVDSHLLIKELKEKISLTENAVVNIPTEMSVPLSQRTHLYPGSAAMNILKSSVGCIVRDCHFHSRRGAVIVRRQGTAWLDGNEISNVTFGIRCLASSSVVLLANVIHDCNTSGIFFRDRASGLVAGNVIFRNGEAGVDIRTGSDPILQHNQIFNGRRSGVVVLDNGRGTLVDNDIYDNREAGIYILYRGNPVIRCNRIWAGQAAGIAVTEDGYGHISFNDISGMEWGGIDIRNGGNPIVLNNTIHNGHGDGVVIGKNGSGIIFENVIKRNCGCGVWVLSSSRPVIFGNHISDCGDHGVAFVSTADDFRENQRLSAQFLQQDQEQDQVAQHHIFDEELSSASFFEENETASMDYLSPHLEKNIAIVDNNTISNNLGSGLSFAGSEGVIIRGNTLSRNQDYGIAIEKPGDVVIYSNSILNNGDKGVSLDVGTIACLRDNCIRGNRGSGIVAHGRGRIKENDIVGNLGCGMKICGPGDPFVTKNRIYSGQYVAVEILENARGCVTNNEIYCEAYEKVIQDIGSTTIVEDNDFPTAMLPPSRGSAGAKGEPADLMDLPSLTSPRPRQTGNAIPRGDISHIVGKLTATHASKANGSYRNMSRFCVIL